MIRPFKFSLCLFAVLLPACGGTGTAVAPSIPSGSALGLHDRLLPQRVRPARKAAHEFLYVANQNDNTLSAFKIDIKTGALTKVKGSPFATGAVPCDIASYPSGGYLYVAYQNVSDSTVGGVSAYSVNPSSGALQQLSGSPFQGGRPCQVAVTPNGAFLYDASPDRYIDDINGYSIDPSSGGLTAISGSPFGTCEDPEGLAVAPSGNFVYAMCTLYTEYDGEIAAYTIDQGNGAITQIDGSPYSTTLSQRGAILPAGGYLFVPNGIYQSNDTVSEYSIDTSSGALAAVSGSPFADGYETYCDQVAVTPSSRYLYVANPNANNVAAYAIAPSGGGLVQVSGSPFAAGTSVEGVTVDPSGNFLFTTNSGSNNVSAFRINQGNGTLTKVKGSPFETGSNPVEAAAIAR